MESCQYCVRASSDAIMGIINASISMLLGYTEIGFDRLEILKDWASMLAENLMVDGLFGGGYNLTIARAAPPIASPKLSMLKNAGILRGRVNSSIRIGVSAMKGRR